MENELKPTAETENRIRQSFISKTEGRVSSSSSLDSKSTIALSVVAGRRRKPHVKWNVEQSHRIPVKTIIVSMDNEMMSRKNEQKFPLQYRYKRPKKGSKIISSKLLEDTPVRSTVPTKPIVVGNSTKQMKKTNLRLVKAQLNSVYRATIKNFGVAFKFMLDPDEKMRIRRNHFRYDGPLIPVQQTRTSELKQEINSYCGRKKIKNWLYTV